MIGVETRRNENIYILGRGEKKREREREIERDAIVVGLLYGNIVLLLEYIIASSDCVGQEVDLYSETVDSPLIRLPISSSEDEREHSKHGLEPEVSMISKSNSTESRRPTGLNDSW